MLTRRMSRRLRVVATSAAAFAIPLGFMAAPASAAPGKPGPNDGGAANAATAPGNSSGNAVKVSGGVATGGDASKPAKALIVYDYDTAYPANASQGEQVAMVVANLASHFGTWTAEPTSAYQQGQVNNYTATIYVGTTYNEPLKPAFVSDVQSTTHPVVWLGDNMWELTTDWNSNVAFQQKYGWIPAAGPAGIHNVHGVTTLTYKGQALTRNVNAGIVLSPGSVTSAATVLATASGASLTDDSGSKVQPFPWAIRGANLTFIGEEPFAYVNESDRVIAFEDLLFDALAPNTPAQHRALVRLEDISCASDPTDLNNDEKYLANQGISYGIAVIPHYKDVDGFSSDDGKPVDQTLAQCPKVLTAVKNMLSHGAVLVDHGDTHQYSDKPNPYYASTSLPYSNPYDGVSADDFEFFMAHIDAGNNVVYDGPVPTDSAAWAQGRVNDALTGFSKAGLSPQIWEFPHYAASYVDYNTIGQNFNTRWDRGLYYNGMLTGAAVTKSSTYIGQFFPYEVTDLYGAKVLPEDMGNYEPEAENNHPARLVPDLLASAQDNLAVRDGFAAFFFHPYYPLSALKQLVQGVKNLGYTFVSPASL
jgi:uncharacterized protein YdaL